MFVCGSCHLELKRTEIGVTIIEMFSRPPQPYKLWQADVLTCPRCERETIQSAQDPYSEHWLEDFSERMDDALAGPHYFAFERVADSEASYAPVKEAQP